MNSRRRFKDEMFGQFARVAKAVANPKRLEIVDVLAQGERTVEGLAREIDQSVANTSQHLQTLKSAHLVEVRRDGLYSYYRLAGEGVVGLWQQIRALGESRLAEIDRLVGTYLSDRKSLEEVGADELLARLETGETLVLDVRPAEEFDAGHILGAVSIPVAELHERLSELAGGKQVVAYCRGPYCVFADEAAALLRSHGFDAMRLREGFPDWQAAGFPVAGGRS